MTDWISLYNAALRQAYPSVLRSDEDWNVLDWPLHLPAEKEVLSELLLALRHGKVSARGYVKIFVFKNNFQELDISRGPANLLAEARSPEGPYFKACGTDSELSIIPADVWNQRFVVWEEDLVAVDFDCVEPTRLKRIKVPRGAALLAFAHVQVLVSDLLKIGSFRTRGFEYDAVLDARNADRRPGRPEKPYWKDIYAYYNEHRPRDRPDFSWKMLATEIETALKGRYPKINIKPDTLQRKIAGIS